MKRSGIAFFLLVIWTLHCSALPLLKEIGRWQCHVKFSALQLCAGNTKLIYTFNFNSETEIVWENEGVELLVKGKLYDVIKITKGNNATVINCLADEDEDQLLLTYHKLINNKTSPAEKKHSDTGQKFLEPDSFNNLYLNFVATRPKSNPIPHVSVCKFEVLVPPPELVSNFIA